MEEIQKPYPDKWYCITNDNEFLEGDSKKEIKKTEAKYYLLKSYAYHNVTAIGNHYYFNKYEVFNSKFKPAKLEYNGVKVIQIMPEAWDKKGYGTYHTGFTITDKGGFSRNLWFSDGIDAVKSCLDFIHELSRYNSWQEYDLYKKIAAQEERIDELEAKNKVLQELYDSILTHRSNVQKLYQTLFEKEIQAGIKHLLSCEQIKDKDLAFAFNIPLKKVKQLKSEE